MESVSIKGPVERIDDQLGLLIPLDSGGRELAECTRGIGETKGKFLKIILQPWLLEKLGAVEGSWVHVDNDGGKLNLRVVGPGQT